MEQDLKMEIETIKKSQMKATLELENLREAMRTIAKASLTEYNR